MKAPEIAARLAGSIGALAAELLPGGRREGQEWRCGSIAGEAGHSMGVHLVGERAGVWCDWAGAPEHRGDALDLVAQVLFRGDKRQAMQWSRAWLGLEQVDPDGFVTHRAAPPVKPARAGDDDGRRRAGAAMKIFLEARPDLRGTLAERYLLSRGIDLSALGRLPRALRFHPGLWNAESRREWPALVAGISGPGGAMVAVHRTWLAPRGAGAGKAPLMEPKRTLGSYAGGCVRLWRGASKKPLAEAPVGETVLIGEGLEDCLTAALALPDRRVLCAVSGGNLGGVLLPAAIGAVLLLGQNEANPVARANWLRAAAAYRRRGLQAGVARPAVAWKDLNEAWQAARQAAAG